VLQCVAVGLLSHGMYKGVCVSLCVCLGGGSQKSSVT